MLYSNKVGIEDKSIDSSHGNSEVALQQQEYESHSSYCKWNEKKEINIGALQTLGSSQGKAKSWLAGSTQNARVIEGTLFI